MISKPGRLGVVLDPRWHDALKGALAGWGLLLLVFTPTLHGLTEVWSGNSYQYAWLVLPMLVYLLGWHHRSAVLAFRPEPGAGGLVLALVAAIGWSASTLMNIDVGRQVSLVLALHAVALSAIGWRAYARLLPVLALAFLMVPAGDLLQPLLRQLTVQVITLFPWVAGLPYQVDGFVIVIAAKPYIVIDECSGLAHFTLALFLGYCFGLLLYRSVFKIAALALLGASLGLLSNALRVNAIVLIDWLRGTQMPLSSHTHIQWVVLLVLLGLLFLLLLRLEPEPEPSVAPPGAWPADRAGPVRRLAPVAAGLVVVLLCGAVVALTHRSQSLAPEATVALPQQLVAWELRQGSPAWVPDPETRSRSLEGSYARAGRQMRVVVIEALAGDAKLPQPRPATQAGNGWREKQVLRLRSCAQSACFDVLHARWVSDKGPDERELYYAYHVGAVTTDSRLRLRAAYGWHRLLGGNGIPRVIALMPQEGAVIAPDDVAPALQALQSAMDKGRM